MQRKHRKGEMRKSFRFWTKINSRRQWIKKRVVIIECTYKVMKRFIEKAAARRLHHEIEAENAMCATTKHRSSTIKTSLDFQSQGNAVLHWPGPMKQKQAQTRKIVRSKRWQIWSKITHLPYWTIFYPASNTDLTCRFARKPFDPEFLLVFLMYDFNDNIFRVNTGIFWFNCISTCVYSLC